MTFITQRTLKPARLGTWLLAGTMGAYWSDQTNSGSLVGVIGYSEYNTDMMGSGLFAMLCKSLLNLLILAAVVTVIVLAAKAWSKVSTGRSRGSDNVAPGAGAP